MQVAVIGAGIVGVTTAYELICDGHDVCVFERRGSVAAEASFANAGVAAPACVTPWAATGTPGHALQRLLGPNALLRLNVRMDAKTLAWMWKAWRCGRTPGDPAQHTRMQRLAQLSRQRLNELTRTLGLDYERSDGCLVLLRTPSDLKALQPALAALCDLGVKFSLLDARKCVAVEPGLNPDVPLHAGIYLPDDGVGNCREFAHLLRVEAQKKGARFHFHTDVTQVLPGARPQLRLRSAVPGESMTAGSDLDSPTQPMADEPDLQAFDAVVVCAALGTRDLLAPLGLKLPLAPLYGYSVTAPMRTDENHPDQGPRSAVIDDRYKVTVSRMGSRVRVAGGAELGGTVARHNKAVLDTLYKVLHDWFPGVARMTHAQRWKGARPMLPDGRPLLGASGIDGVWLNLGHGGSGWSLACGSARVVADKLAGRAGAIDLDGLGIERLPH